MGGKSHGFLVGTLLAVLVVVPVGKRVLGGRVPHELACFRCSHSWVHFLPLTSNKPDSFSRGQRLLLSRQGRKERWAGSPDASVPALSVTQDATILDLSFIAHAITFLVPTWPSRDSRSRWPCRPSCLPPKHPFHLGT